MLSSQYFFNWSGQERARSSLAESRLAGFLLPTVLILVAVISSLGVGMLIAQNRQYQLMRGYYYKFYLLQRLEQYTEQIVQEHHHWLSDPLASTEQEHHWQWTEDGTVGKVQGQGSWRLLLQEGDEEEDEDALAARLWEIKVQAQLGATTARLTRVFSCRRLPPGSAKTAGLARQPPSLEWGSWFIE